MILPKYSVAIRTLGTAGEKFRIELESIGRQTVLPEKVIVYVAESTGVKFHDDCFCGEKYVYVPKGMVAQRALDYDDVDSDYLLLLDDDVELAPDSAEKMLKAMVEKDADCVGADIFENHNMSKTEKAWAIVTNLVSPHFDKEWGLKIHANGSYSYLSKVKGLHLVPTQKLDGPCVMWKKDVIQRLRWKDELWMDHLSEFAYGDDTVESYKLHVNGGKLWLMYDCGVTYLNAKTASTSYHHTHKKYYVRSLMSFCIWWRTIYEVECELKQRNLPAMFGKGYVVFAFCLKWLWLLLVNTIAIVLLMDIHIPYYYIKGTRDGWKFVHSQKYKALHGYMI